MNPMLWKTLLMLVWIVWTDSSTNVKFRRVKVKFQGVTVFEDLQYDRREKTALVNVPGGYRTDSCLIEESSNLHDLERRTLAIKLVRSGRCYLLSHTESVAEMEDLVKKYGTIRPNLLKYATETDPVPVKNVAREAGEKIAAFCKDYETSWLTDQSPTIISEPGRVKRNATDGGRVCIICFKCVIHTNSTYG